MPCVAIVDDEEQVRRALKRLLVASGFQVESYASGQDFLAAAAQPALDCVVLDLHMPGLSGLQVLQRLKATSRDLPAVIITAYDAPEMRKQCLAAGARAYLCKPLDDRLLLNSISASLARSTARRYP